jgi:repressor LexA
MKFHPGTSLPLTPAQSRALEFIREFLSAKGVPPTRAELAQGLGLDSRNTADFHIKALIRKGHLEAIPGARGIRLTEDEGLPLVGKVTAGTPILAQENVAGHYRIDPDIFSPPADYLLEVRGMSMRDAGIVDGDWIGVRKTAEARSGQIAVVRIDDEVTIKKLKLKGDRAELISANPDFEPIVVDLKRQAFAVEGIPVGMIRRFR